MILPRSELDRISPRDDSSSVESPSSGRDQMIIGVVLGSVILLMILTAVLLIRLKRKSQARRRQRFEDRLLAHQQHLSAMGFYPGPPSAALSGPARGQSQDGLGLGLGFKPLPTPDYYPPQHHQEQEQGQDQQPVEPASALSTSSAERRAFADPPPAYQVQPLPAYDPSRYHGVDRFDSFRAQGGVGYAGGGYGHVDGQAWRAQGQGGVGVDHMVGIAVPYPGVRASMYRFEEGEGGVRRVPERDEMAFSFAETAFSLGEDVGSGGGGGGGGDGGRGRRRGGVFLDGDESQGEGVVQRPRPVLSRLVTDFR